MYKMYIDIETYSDVDLKTAGVYKYTQSPAFTVLLFSYAIGDNPIETVDLMQEKRLRLAIISALLSPEFIKYAHNAQFEIACLQKYLGIALPVDQWRCTMLHSFYLGYPGKLEDIGPALGIEEEKQKITSGKALIQYFSKPCKPTKTNGGRTRNLPHHDPAKWQAYKEYNAGDVVAERAIHSRLATFPVPDDVQRQWVTDIAINARGVGVDLLFVQNAIMLRDKDQAALMAEAQQITGLDNPNSVTQMCSWLSDRLQSPVRSLTKDVVEVLLTTSLPDDVRRALEIRQEIGKTSLKKYDAIVDTVCDDDRAKGQFQFYGAGRTGRWAGRGIQLQNLTKTDLPALDVAREMVKNGQEEALRLFYGSVSSTLSQLIRTAFVPSPGNVFIDVDFSSIEARVISWLAGETWRLDVFKTHGKIYEASAAQMFGVPITDIVKGRPEYALRQRGKVAELALGYQGGEGALKAMGALKMGLEESELEGIKNRWRKANPRIVELWHTVEAAAVSAVGGDAVTIHGLTFARESNPLVGLDFLTIQLPSGRKLFYANPCLAINQWGQPGIRYWGMNQTSKKWQRIETYGGKLIENVVQAIARDCLAEAIDRVVQAGHTVVASVHDEILIEYPAHTEFVNDYQYQGLVVKELCDLVAVPISWAPDLPLAADGWTGKYYKKD